MSNSNEKIPNHHKVGGVYGWRFMAIYESQEEDPEYGFISSSELVEDVSAYLKDVVDHDEPNQFRYIEIQVLKADGNWYGVGSCEFWDEHLIA